MALSYINAGAAQANTVTIPSGHATGDLLLIFAFRDGSTTAPSLPAGWTSVGANTGTACSSLVGYKIATSGAETSGTWTNANALVCQVYRGQYTAGVPVINSAGNAGTTSSVDYAGITTMTTPGISWVARFAGHVNVDTSLETPPTGHTFRAGNVGATCEVAGFDTNGAVGSSTFGSVSAGGTAGAWITKTLEILPDNTQAGIVAKTGQLAAPASTGLSITSDPGIQPKAVMFWNGLQTATGASADAQFSLGWATSTTNETSAGYNSDDNVGTTDSVRSFNTARLGVNTTSGTTTNNLVYDLSSLSPAGFTTNWATLGTPSALYNYLAIGGADITNVAAGNYAMNTGTGEQSVTGLGFQPDIVFLFANLQATSATSNANNNYGFGVMHKSGSQWSIAQKQANAIAASNTNRSFTNQACLVLTQTAGDVVYSHEQSFVSMDPGGFTVNISTALGTASLVGYLAIKGGNWKVGHDTQKTSTGTKATTGVGFTPDGVIFGSVGDTQTAGIAADARLSFGASTGPSNNVAIWTGDKDTSDPTIANTYVANNKAIIMATEGASAATTIDAVAELDSFDADGFTMDWTTADATARVFGYVAFGDGPSTALQVTRTAATAASDDDALEAAGTVTLTDTTAAWNGTNHLGFRFPNVDVAQGETITSATLKLQKLSAYTGTGLVNGTIYGEDVDNAAVFTTAASSISGRTRTTANRVRVPADITIESQGVDVTAIVQEIVDRGGWVSGNAMAMLLISSASAGNNITPYMWDYFTGTYVAQLILKYDVDAPTSTHVGLTLLGVG